MNKDEMDLQWKNFIDDIASIFHWSADNGDGEGIYRSGLEGDMPLTGLDRFYVSREIGKLLDKYEIALPNCLYLTILSTMSEKHNSTEVSHE